MEMCTIWLLEVLCIFSTLMMVKTSVNTSRKPNVKNTTQSSTYSLDLPSCKTVDGCTTPQFEDNCCSHTGVGQQEAWWQIDLEGLIVMEYIKIYYRDDGYQQRQRFGGYQIYQSNTSDWRNGYLCYKDTTSTSAALSLTPRINCTGTAQYLTIYNHRQSEDAYLELCEVEVYGCPLGKYGDGNCDSDCGVGCADNLCDPVTGNCAYCDDGFCGSHCDNCSVGCTNFVCDKVSGNCSPCKPGYHGDTCNIICPSNCKRDICNQTSGLCTDCEDGFFGSSCDSCPVGCTNQVCDKNSGNCSSCSNGLYGRKCDKSCPAGCQNDVCTQSEGICTACKRGYYGDTCNKTCPSNCEGDICNQTSGLCTECKSGFYGDDCKQICPTHCHNSVCVRSGGNCSACEPGYFGQHCNMSCTGHCDNDECRQDNGTCIACTSGYFGPDCDDECRQCSALSCSRSDGLCLCGDKPHGTCGCTNGWEGEKCITKKAMSVSDQTGTYAGAGVGAVIVIALLVIATVAILRRKGLLPKRKKENRREGKSKQFGNVESLPIPLETPRRQSNKRDVAMAPLASDYY